MFPRSLSNRSLITAGALALSAVMAVDTAAAEPAKTRNYKDPDLLSQSDIDRAQGGYRLSVPGVGTVVVKALKASRAGKDCSIYKPGLVKALAAKPLAPGEAEWVELSIYFKPGGKTVCDLPPGGGCYVMVAKD